MIFRHHIVEGFYAAGRQHIVAIADGRRALASPRPAAIA
jgi:hypothetical protein